MSEKRKYLDYIGLTNLIEKIKELFSSSVADWNQNDESAYSYVKNRPFWAEDIIEVPMLEESTFTLESDCYTEIESDIIFEIGSTYKVIFDGATYECVSYEVYETPCIGNNAIADFEEGNGNGEPFFCCTVDGYFCLITSTSGTHVISIANLYEEVHKIDKKYIGADIEVLDSDVTELKETVSTLTTDVGSRVPAYEVTEIPLSNGVVTCPFICYQYDNNSLYYDCYFVPSQFLSVIGTTNYRTYTCTAYRFYSEKLQKVLIQFRKYSGGEITFMGVTRTYGWVLGDNLILNSSTEDSTKQFEITVDDTGTLSATEIT